MTNNEKTTFLNVLAYTTERTVDIAKQSPVIGEPIVIDTVTIIPVSKVSAGFAGGGADIADEMKKRKKNPTGIGAKVNVTPVSFLVIDGKNIKTVKVDSEKSGAGEALGAIIAKIKAENAKKKAEKKAQKKAEKLAKAAEKNV